MHSCITASLKKLQNRHCIVICTRNTPSPLIRGGGISFKGVLEPFLSVHIKDSWNAVLVVIQNIILQITVQF